MAIDLSRSLAALSGADTVRVTGSVRGLVGLSIRAAIPGVRLGEVVEIERRDRAPLLAEVVGFQLDDATLMPLGTTEGVGPDDPVRPTGRALTVRCGEGVL
ncbi:MAG: EscN/YscN/HrcN family type III secretion system ATPase, partial [Myxococcota bacterium]|nr:EscN/YscN/HrcN family type III secretion system ATPase [Myxococcota bacterium]